MKPSLVILFLAILLLCVVFLRAATNYHRIIRMDYVKEEVTKAEVRKDMQFLPNVILL